MSVAAVPVPPATDDGAPLRVVGAGEPWVTGEEVGGLVEGALAAVEALGFVDPGDLDPEALTSLAAGLERLGRRVHAAAVGVAAHVDRAERFCGEGSFGSRAWSQHRLGVSGAEAFRRAQVARFFERCGLWANAAVAGLVGVAQTELMARVVANPRISDEVVDRDRFELLQDAMDLPFRDFERRVRRWEMSADPVGAAAQVERQLARRDVRIRRRPEGGWRISGWLDEVAGAELHEVWAHFVDGEWRADWDEARARLGDDATAADLGRTQAQRHADGLVTMARTAAGGGSGDAGRAVPTVNLLIDEESFRATVKGEEIATDRYRDVVCRTRSGVELHPREVVNTALWAHVRRVVYDGSGTVIDLGRRRRLFTGAAREAVLLMATECAWVGCDRPVGWCQADHSIGWTAHGATVPRNGQPLCGRHNRFKERGYRVHRDADGTWHTHHPDGHEIT